MNKIENKDSREDNEVKNFKLNFLQPTTMTFF